MLVWPETHLRLEGAATWQVLMPGEGGPSNLHCERQPHLAAIPAAHICKSTSVENKREKGSEKTTPLGVILMKSAVLYWAAQENPRDVIAN